MDGTLIAARDRTVGASSLDYRFSANVQIVMDADTKPVVATALATPGNRADARGRRGSGPAEQAVPGRDRSGRGAADEHLTHSVTAGLEQG
ncbi:hypothetical protein [Streptomyces enissocaesilis]|uniref:Transposase n=1 Tax=Streptomyces enissocaesilis TaxID=332589 RepID=A0ABP6K7J7_9ACTN